jgi:two-component system sensor histidine kinase UhpB
MVGAIFSLNNARQNAIAEVRSAEKLVLYLLEDATLNNKKIESINKNTFNLQTLGHMRHIRIELLNEKGKLIDSNITEFNELEDEAPVWFVSFINRLSAQWEPNILPLYFDGKLLGNLVVTPDPSYEYAEKWKQLKE